MSLRKAINEKCRECIYDPNADGAWRMQVSECTSYDCPLYPYRPLSKARSALKNSKSGQIAATVEGN